MDLGAFSVSLTVKDLAVSRAFYEKLGFEVTGEAFLEDGIPHAPMALNWSRAPASARTGAAGPGGQK